jgi:hypothetical protein
MGRPQEVFDDKEPRHLAVTPAYLGQVPWQFREGPCGLEKDVMDNPVFRVTSQLVWTSIA